MRGLVVGAVAAREHLELQVGREWAESVARGLASVRRGQRGTYFDAINERCLGIWSSGGVPDAAKLVKLSVGRTAVFVSGGSHDQGMDIRCANVVSCVKSTYLEQDERCTSDARDRLTTHRSTGTARHYGTNYSS